MAVIALVAFAVSFLCVHSNYELVEAENRNIIFVGRSRAGKTTLIEVLKNKDYNPGLSEILVGTKEASLQSFTMHSRSHKQSLHFNMMDTPGLFERAPDDDDERTNVSILALILNCIALEITKINHVYFVMSIQQGLNADDLKAFDIFTRKAFVGMEDKISIIVSFAQNLSTKKQYDHYINQFKKVRDLKPIYDQINGRIFFVGAAQETTGYDMAKLKANVYEQRAALFEHIVNQKDAYNVTQLQIYQDMVNLRIRRQEIEIYDHYKAKERKHYQVNQDLLKRVRNLLFYCEQKKGWFAKMECLPYRDIRKYDSFLDYYKPEKQKYYRDKSEL